MMDLKYCLPQSMVTLIILALGQMRINNPQDKSLEELFFEN